MKNMFDHMLKVKADSGAGNNWFILLYYYYIYVYYYYCIFINIGQEDILNMEMKK